jgi:hypothetical protein
LPRARQVTQCNVELTDRTERAVMRRTRFAARSSACRRRARPAPAALRATARRDAAWCTEFRRPPAPPAWPSATKRVVGEAARRRGPNAPC